MAAVKSEILKQLAKNYPNFLNKDLSKLVDIYYNSVGLNSSLLLNLPVDSRGLVHENEVANLKALAAFLKKTFTVNLAQGQELKTSTVTRGYPAEFLIDMDLKSYWISQANDIKPTIELLLEAPLKANTFMIQEYLPMGQRIKSFTLEILRERSWVKVYEGTTIGNKRLVRFDTQTINGIRFTVNETKAQVVLSNLGLFKAPELNEE